MNIFSAEEKLAEDLWKITCQNIVDKDIYICVPVSSSNCLLVLYLTVKIIILIKYNTLY